MVFNTTEREIENNFGRDIVKKVRLENELATELDSSFEKVGNDFENSFIQTNNAITTAETEREFDNIMSNHYDRTGNTFKKDLRRRLTRAQLLETMNTLDDRIDEKLDNFKSEKLKTQTRFVKETNRKEFLASVSRIKRNALEEGRQLSQQQLAREANEDFKMRAKARTATIANTETQIVAEEAKDIEASTLQQNNTELNDGTQINENNMKKIWNTVLDERTRLDHAFADGQRRDKSKPFDVGNSRMMKPGDTSLGAPPEQIINCRCSSNYSVE